MATETEGSDHRREEDAWLWVNVLREAGVDASVVAAMESQRAALAAFRTSEEGRDLVVDLDARDEIVRMLADQQASPLPNVREQRDELLALRNELREINLRISGPAGKVQAATCVPTPAAMPAASRARRPSVSAEITPFISELLRAHPGWTAKQVCSHCRDRAGGHDSPFMPQSRRGEALRVSALGGREVSDKPSKT